MLYCNGFLFVQARENLKCLYWAVTPSRRCPLRGTGNLNFSTWTSAKWELHINAKYIEVNGKICNIQTSAYYMQKLKAKYAIYRLLHILHIKLHISAYFHCIFFAYLTNTVYIFAYFLHISWLYLHIFSIYLHITCIFKHISGIFCAYFLNIWLIQSIYLHIFCISEAYNCIFMAYNCI